MNNHPDPAAGLVQTVTQRVFGLPGARADYFGGEVGLGQLRAALAAALGLEQGAVCRGARSHCRFAQPLIHFIPYSLTYSVALFEVTMRPNPRWLPTAAAAAWAACGSRASGRIGGRRPARYVASSHI